MKPASYLTICTVCASGGLQQEGEKKRSQIPIMNSFSSYCDTVNNPTEQKLQKYIWSPDQLSTGVSSFFRYAALSFVRNKAARPSQSSGYGEVSYLHILFKDAKNNTFVTHTHTVKTSAAATRLKGGHRFDTLHTTREASVLQNTLSIK